MSYIELGGTVKSGGPFSSVDGNSQTAPNFADPVNPQDLATKNYVDTNGSVTIGLEGAYAAALSPSDNILSLTSALGPSILRDNATPLTGSLFAVQNSAGTQTFLGVTALGPSVSGPFAIGATGAFNLSTRPAIRLENTTAATSGAHTQDSPAIVFSGTCWDGFTTSGPVSALIYAAPGYHTNPSVDLNFGHTNATTGNALPLITLRMNETGFSQSEFIPVVPAWFNLGSTTNEWNRAYFRQYMTNLNRSPSFTTGTILFSDTDSSTQHVTMTGNSSGWDIATQAGDSSWGSVITFTFIQDSTGGWTLGAPTQSFSTIKLNGTFQLNPAANSVTTITLVNYSNSGGNKWAEVSRSNTSGVSAHSALTGLTTGDDHTQYALLAGRSGGQTIVGGVAGDVLTLTGSAEVGSAAIVLESTTAGQLTRFNTDVAWEYKGGGGGRFFSPFGATGPNQQGDGLSFFAGSGTGTERGGHFTVAGGNGDETSGTGDGGDVLLAGGLHAIGGGADGRVIASGSAFLINLANISINTVDYVFPGSQGAASSVLTNDGLGGLSWAAPAGSAATDALNTTGAPVNVSLGAPGVAGQVLTLTDATHATWQAPSASGMADGTILPTPFTCPSGVAVRDAVYVSGDDAVDKADASNPALRPARGLVSSKLTSTSCKLQVSGEMGGFAGLVADEDYVLDVSSGAIIAKSATSGFATGTIVQTIGWARNSTTLVIEMDTEFTVL